MPFCANCGSPVEGRFCPSCGAAVGGAADVIEHGHNGWLIPPNDPDALSAALVQWLSDPVGRAALAQRARERVLAEFALPVMAARLRDLYARLAGHLEWQTGN
jgi:glycosyltransferase involved in cell wall biosynthesis